MGKPSVVLADDHGLVLAGISRILENGFDVMGTAGDGCQLLALCEKLKPDLVLLDISMPLMNGIEAARRLKVRLPKTKIVVVTIHSEREYVTEAFRAGADGYLLKSSAASELVTAIERVLSGHHYLTPFLTQCIVDTVLDEPPGRGSRHLSSRQRSVLQLVAEGNSAKEVASLLGISAKTVEFHKAAVAAKLGLRGLAAMVKYAVEHGICGENPRTAASHR
ncbi:MAG: response regulator transcription factor [Bryobacteraceae bacterium]